MNISKEQDTLLKIIFGIIIFILFVYALSYQAYNQFSLKQNSIKTYGVVTRVTVEASRKSYLYYNYIVGNDTLEGRVGVDFIGSKSLKLKYLNKKFKVYYSVKNPKNSMIDLGKYNECKTTVVFFKPY
ncbi:hypothetical protein [Flavobacterium sp. NRK F7]|uniref:hypothetical protein n=1 Tax=Flavobacterium sp. NRK F7 TaxID=2954930 RepID=UPI002090F54D|nr:hypothetical protein [Flavobacterium sp. NRK F7]MCO6162098.1 hypothetical protein [Flavobacterium sp. NRK F7]